MAWTSSLLFVLTTAIGVWAAIDRVAAFERFLLMFLGMMLMMTIALLGRHRNGEAMLTILGSISALCLLVLSIVFMIFGKWGIEGANDFILFFRFHDWIEQYQPHSHFYKSLHPNSVAGALILLLPYGFISTLWAYKSSRLLVGSLNGLAVIVAFLTLLMTSSRGALFGLAMGIIACIYLARRWHNSDYSLLGKITDCVVITFFGTLLFGWLYLGFQAGAQSLGLTSSILSRSAIWQDSLSIIEDYWYSGSGLGETTMILSSYVFLLHVPFLDHAHNLFLQIAVEQGVPGVVAFILLVVAALWNLVYVNDFEPSVYRLFRYGTVVSIIALLVHGLVDAEFYVRHLGFLVFVPFGFAFALPSMNVELIQSTGSKQPSRDLAVESLQLFLPLVPMLVVALLFLQPGSFAKVDANLGAVTQSRAELSLYQWPEWPVQDAVRLSEKIDLAQSIAYYEQALVRNPKNVTANRRLGQILLSRGDFVKAQKYLESAYLQSPHQRATRQLLGEVYAVRGEIKKAVTLLETVDTSNGQLEIRYHWYKNNYAGVESDRILEVIELIRRS